MSTQTNTSDSVPPPPRPIRFVHNQGQPPSKRRRINAACLTCRKRKTRCAGERPVCSTCTKNGHRCLGYPEEIKREDIEKLPLDKAGHDRDEHEHEHHNYHDADIKVEKVPVPVQRTPDAPTPHVALEPTMSLANMIDSKQDTTETPSAPSHNSHHPSSLPAQNTPSPTAVRKSERHRVPYFRYFGPTAIVPGFKQMVVSVRDRRRSTAGSMAGTSPISIHSGPQGSSSVVSEAISEELPTYDPNDPAPVHPLIISLINTFFTQMGSSYPFLRQTKFLRMVKEKRVEPILVDSICALSARFSDSPALTNGNDKMPRMERGSVFAQRARQATVDTFPCPTVGAVQACLLMAYEGFGAGQDSALWMYLGLAIRMAVDLGLQKEVGVQYHGEKDALYSQNWGRQPVDEADSEAKAGESSHLNPQEQKELVQERMDTFWAVFVLDRVISSGTGRPVTFRDDDLELSFPEPFIDPATNWPAPYPIFLQIIHLYGRVCDVLNKVRNAQDLTKETWDKLGEMEHELTRLYKNWDWRLQFNVSNFKAYLGAGQGTTFILLHFWFHALFIILHQPTLLTPFAELRSELQLLPDSRELSMSSAKTICDILSFADLIDPKSFIGNPFTCQPIYIAACAFVMESSANASSSPSRASSPPGAQHTATAGNKSRDAKSSRHSLLASAANQNYQKCFNSLQQIEQYWGGATYIITALDQRAKGIWDCETYTAEEYESTKMPRRGSNGALNNPFPKFENKASPRLSGPPIAWTLAGTANSPNSSLTLMYQNRDTPAQTGPQQTQPLRAPSTPPGNMIFDPIRQSLPDSTNMLAPAYPQPNISAVRQSRPAVPRRTSNLSATSAQTRPHVQFDGVPEDSESHDFYTGPRFTPTSQPSTGFDAYSVSPPTAMTENGVTPATTLSGANHMYFGHGQNNFPYTMPWANSMGSMDGITFDSQDIDIAALGLQQSDMMGPWLDYFPSDVLGLLEQQQHQHPHMGQGGH